MWYRFQSTMVRRRRSLALAEKTSWRPDQTPAIRRNRGMQLVLVADGEWRQFVRSNIRNCQVVPGIWPAVRDITMCRLSGIHEKLGIQYRAVAGWLRGLASCRIRK